MTHASYHPDYREVTIASIPPETYDAIPLKEGSDRQGWPCKHVMGVGAGSVDVLFYREAEP